MWQSSQVTSLEAPCSEVLNRICKWEMASFRLQWIHCSFRWSLWFLFDWLLKPAVSSNRKMTKFDLWDEKASDLKRKGWKRAEGSAEAIHTGTWGEKRMDQSGFVSHNVFLRGQFVNLTSLYSSACICTNTSNSIIKPEKKRRKFQFSFKVHVVPYRQSKFLESGSDGLLIHLCGLECHQNCKDMITVNKWEFWIIRHN